MRCFAKLLTVQVLGVATMVASAAVPAGAQPMDKSDVAALAHIEAQIGEARDSMQAELAKAGNTKTIFQQDLREKLNTQIAGILQRGGLTQAEYERRTYIVSTDAAARKTYDSVMVAVTGQPIPGQVPAGQGGKLGSPEPQQIPVPAGGAGTHIGHVINAFNGTPNGAGLLPTAFAEAKVAAQHASLAMKNATNLAAMKMHAGHVLNAVDPSQMPQGPGYGYGVKKAAEGVADHIEFAAKAPGASENVKLHSVHIATAARNTVARCDSIITIVKEIQAATTVAQASALVSQMSSLADQLINGADKNGDGKITWQEGEGGLQVAQDHVNLMLAGEKKG